MTWGNAASWAHRLLVGGARHPLAVECWRVPCRSDRHPAPRRSRRAEWRRFGSHVWAWFSSCRCRLPGGGESCAWLFPICLCVPRCWVLCRAPSRTRTDTVRILSPLPLPIGLWGPRLMLEAGTA